LSTNKQREGAQLARERQAEGTQIHRAELSTTQKNVLEHRASAALLVPSRCGWAEGNVQWSYILRCLSLGGVGCQTHSKVLGPHSHSKICVLISTTLKHALKLYPVRSCWWADKTSRHLHALCWRVTAQYELSRAEVRLCLEAKK
jgi:hypothetical protein